MAPALREAYDLDLKGVGFFLAAEWVGLTIALLPWGLVTDRIGERRALGVGLSACGLVMCSIAQVIAVFLRVGVGRWSDVLRSRIVPLRRVGIATTAALAAAAIVLGASDAVVVSLLVLATSLSAAWNGLSFVAAAEIAGAARSGAAIGFQQTVLSVAGVVVPPLFAATVDASSWRLGFAAAALAPVAGRLPPQ